MKLYTEEQMRVVYNLGFSDSNNNFGRKEDETINFFTPIELPSDEQLAILFHNKYEELAPKFGYETRMETKEFKKDSNNGKLMIAVCREILQILNQKTNNL